LYESIIAGISGVFLLIIDGAKVNKVLSQGLYSSNVFQWVLAMKKIIFLALFSFSVSVSVSVFADDCLRASNGSIVSSCNLFTNNGSITAGYHAINVGSAFTVGKITNETGATIYSTDNYSFGMFVSGAINWLSNSGRISGKGPGNGLYITGTGSRSIDLIDNYGIINVTNTSANSDSWGIGLDGNGSVTTLNNYLGGTIEADKAIYMGNAIGNAARTNHFGTINNFGFINGLSYGVYLSAGQYSIDVLNNAGGISGGLAGISNLGTIDNLNNTGSITGSNAIKLEGRIGTLSNTGNISGTGASSAAISIGITGSPSTASIGNLFNSGSIYSATGNAIVLNVGTQVTTITNTGSIDSGVSGKYSIESRDASITNLNNSYSALTFSGTLPTNYNIIIDSSSTYGKLIYTSKPPYLIGNMAFAIAPGSSVINNHLYQNVLTGLVGTLSGSTITGTGFSITGATGTYGVNNYSYLLVADDGNVAGTWDLFFGSLGPTAADTQASLHSLTPKLRGAFSSQTMATNFANMNTYDCNLFDAKGLCVSVGGQQTYVDSSSANMTSAVVVAGYKVSPTLRIGGFLNQNVNSNTGSNVDISNKSPLMGLFAVWNQNESQLGYQVKVANAYQDMDVTTIRDVIGTSEAGRGKTDLNTQSYVGELSYAFLTNEDKTLVRPYAAVRYTRIKQDGYSERTTSAVTVPLTYAAISDRSTAALVGVKLNHKLTDKVNLTGSLGVEQDLNHDVDNLTATGVAGLTSENFNDSIKRTRPVASIGAYYMPVKNQRIAADIYYQQLPFQSTASTTAYVNYMIGF
jgi:hypothetical protein